MKRLILTFILILLFVSGAAAGAGPLRVATPLYDLRDAVSSQAPTDDFVLWFDDMESGEGGWSHVDETAVAVAHFHVTTFNAYPDGGSYSWYCGDEELTADGGYANGWDDRLNLPPIDIAGAAHPVWTFAYRYDSEPDYDFTFVQAESLGEYVNLCEGYSGSSGGWQDYGEYGFRLLGCDSPLVARYRFVSDGAWSDADVYGDTDGGAFSVDNIKVFDFISGTVYFLDDAESGGLCEPGKQAASGDWWHIADDYCSSYSPRHSWWCGDDADTSHLPPNLANSLLTPVIDYDEGPSWADSIGFRHLMHCEIPVLCGDYWVEHVSMDGGETWYQTAMWVGDFTTCDGWMGTPYYGHRVDKFGPGPFVYKWTLYTDDDGCGPGVGGGVGLNLDDAWLEPWGYMPVVTETSWGSIKAMYR